MCEDTLSFPDFPFYSIECRAINQALSMDVVVEIKYLNSPGLGYKSHEVGFDCFENNPIKNWICHPKPVKSIADERTGGS